jgi:hypothetical protein
LWAMECGVQALRSPIPLLVVRRLVKEDAPFAISHPLLIPTYIWNYSLAAPRWLLAGLSKIREQVGLGISAWRDPSVYEGGRGKRPLVCVTFIRTAGFTLGNMIAR